MNARVRTRCRFRMFPATGTIFLMVLFQAALALAAPNLFWIDCGPQNNCNNAALYYVDAGAAAPAATLLVSGVWVSGEDGNIFGTGTVNATTHNVTNLKIGYVAFIKGGKIWKVDAATRAVTQVSSEAGITPSGLCEVNFLTNWTTPLNSIVQYRLAQPGFTCQSGQPVTKFATLGMGAATAPFVITNKHVDEILINGQLIVRNYAFNPNKVQKCLANMTGCIDVTTFSSDSGMEGASTSLDAQRILFGFDEKLKLYNFTLPVSATNPVTLYTPAPNEVIDEDSLLLAAGGTVYFTTRKTVAPFTNAIRKVSAAGTGLTSLATFTTSYPLQFLGVGQTSTRILFMFPAATMNSAILYSVPKAGGPTTLISTSMVAGTKCGDYLFLEDTLGRVGKFLADGTGAQWLYNAQLTGQAMGGSANFDDAGPASLASGRVFVTDIYNRLKSYGCGDVISDPNAGIALGTVPVNLSNPSCSGVGSTLLCRAGRRDAGFSFGRDTVLVNGLQAASLRRMTNSNGYKRILDDEE